MYIYGLLRQNSKSTAKLKSTISLNRTLSTDTIVKYTYMYMYKLMFLFVNYNILKPAYSNSELMITVKTYTCNAKILYILTHFYHTCTCT